MGRVVEQLLYKILIARKTLYSSLRFAQLYTFRIEVDNDLENIIVFFMRLL